MEDRRIEKLPFDDPDLQIEPEKDRGSGSLSPVQAIVGPGGAARTTREPAGSAAASLGGPDDEAEPGASRLPFSALALLLLLIGVFAYLSFRQLGGMAAPPEAPSHTATARSAPAPPQPGSRPSAQPDTPALPNRPFSEAPPDAQADVARSDPRPSSPDPLAAARSGDYPLAARAWVQAVSAGARADSWTLQISANCNTGNLGPLFAPGAPDSDRYFLLPVTIEGRSCYRVCYGLYTDRAAAEAEGRRISDQRHPGLVARTARVTDLLPQ